MPSSSSKRGRHLAIADADAVAEIHGPGPQPRADAAAQDFTVAGLRHPQAAILAPGRRVPIQHDLIPSLDDVFLPVIVGLDLGKEVDNAATVRAVTGSLHFDQLIVLGRPGAEPARMADGRPAFLPLAVDDRLARGSPGGRRFRFVQARGGGKLALPFDFQFQLELFDLGLKPDIFLEQLGVAFPLEIELPQQHLEVLIVIAGRIDERPQCGAAQMRAMRDLRAGVFVRGVEAKLHRHPFLRMPNISRCFRPRQPRKAAEKGDRHRNK